MKPRQQFGVPSQRKSNQSGATHRLLEHAYQSVVAFEERVRLSFGVEFASVLPENSRERILSRLMDLVGDGSDHAKLAYIRLVDEVLKEIGTQVSVKELSVLWPRNTLAATEAAFLRANGCPCLATIAARGSMVARRRGPFHPDEFEG
jgi:hypothetical protein